MFKWFTNLFKRIPSKGRLKHTTIREIINKLEKVVEPGIINLNKLNVYFLDEFYNVTSKEEMVQFLKRDKLNFVSGSAENDCDDFAFRFMGRIKEKSTNLAVGLAISSRHAYNIFIDSKRNIYGIEPQTDKILSISQLKKDKEYYPIKYIIM